MQERRTLVYMDQDDIPKSAVEFKGGDNMDDSPSGNVVYIPVSPGRMIYDGKGRYGVLIWGVGQNASQINCNGSYAIWAPSTTSNPYSGRYCVVTSNKIAWYDGSTTTMYYVPGVLSGSNFYTNYPNDIEGKYLKITFNNPVILKWNTSYDFDATNRPNQALTYPFYIDTEN